MVFGALCGLAARVHAEGEPTVADAMLATIEQQDVVGFARLVADPLELRSLRFDSAECARFEGQHVTVSASDYPAFLKCAATLELQVPPPPDEPRPGWLARGSVLEFEPGGQLHFGVRDGVVNAIIGPARSTGAIMVDRDAMLAHVVSGQTYVDPDDGVRAAVAHDPEVVAFAMIVICVDRAGIPTPPKLAYRSPAFPSYSNAAVAAVAGWKLKPFLRHGKPIESCAWLPFVYPSDRAPPRPPPPPPPPHAVSESSEPAPAEAAPASEVVSAGHFLPLEPTRVSLSMGFGGMSIKHQVAANQQAASSGFELGSRLALQFFDVLSIGVSFGVGGSPDRGSFAQDVVSGDDGDETSASSGMWIMRYGVDVSARTPFWAIGPMQDGWFAGALFAGVGIAGISGGRDTADCPDCLPLSGGTFWRVGADFTSPQENGQRWGFTAEYQSYLGDASLDGEFLVSLGRWW